MEVTAVAVAVAVVAAVVAAVMAVVVVVVGFSGVVATATVNFIVFAFACCVGGAAGEELLRVVPKLSRQVSLNTSCSLILVYICCPLLIDDKKKSIALVLSRLLSICSLQEIKLLLQHRKTKIRRIATNLLSSKCRK